LKGSIGFSPRLLDETVRHLGDLCGDDLHVIGQIPGVDRYAVVYTSVAITLGDAGCGSITGLGRRDENIAGRICRQRVRYRSRAWELAHFVTFAPRGAGPNV